MWRVNNRCCVGGRSRTSATDPAAAGMSSETIAVGPTANSADVPKNCHRCHTCERSREAERESEPYTVERQRDEGRIETVDWRQLSHQSVRHALQ
jgi:hypothetical protein